MAMSPKRRMHLTAVPIDVRDWMKGRIMRMMAAQVEMKMVISVRRESDRGRRN